MELFKRRNSNIYTARFYIDGFRFTRTTGETDKKAAEKKAHQIYLKTVNDAGARTRKHCKLSLSDIARIDIETQAIQVADPTALKIRLKYIWKIIIKTAGDINPNTWCESKTVRYIKLRKLMVKNQTIKKELQVLKRGLNLAMRRSIIEKQDHYWPYLKNDPPDNQKKGHIWNNHDIKRLCDNVPDDIKDEIYFVLLTGLRKTEIKRVKFCHINDDVLTLPAEITKNNRLRRIPLARYAMHIIKKRKLISDDDYIFSRKNHARTLRTVSRMLGFERSFTLRDARHMFHTVGLQVSGDQTSVMRLAGNGLQVIERYQHTTYDRDKTTIEKISQYSSKLFA